VIAIMTALCVATNYLLVGVVNVKFMDLIVFVSGIAFGGVVGGSVGVLTWLVYGTINPYGFSLPILAATCVGEAIYGLAGGLLGQLNFPKIKRDGRKPLVEEGIKFAIIGFLLTSVYDFLTNFVTALFLGLPLLAVLIAGIPFALIHEVSNSIFFFVGVSPLVSVIKRLPISDISKEMKLV
jgi:hypothetical protein